MNIDTFVLHYCENFSHLTQKWVGATCFDLARLCLLLFMILECFSVIFLKQHPPDEPWAFNLLWIVAFSLLIFVSIGRMENMTSSAAFKGLKNPRQNHPLALGVRISLLLGAAYSSLNLVSVWVFSTSLPLESDSASHPILLAIVGLSTSSLIVLAFYFTFSTPLPPGNSKLDSWIERLNHKNRRAA